MKKIICIFAFISLVLISCGTSSNDERSKEMSENNKELVGEWYAVHRVDSLFDGDKFVSSNVDLSFSREVALEYNEEFGWPKICFRADNTCNVYDYDPIKDEYIKDNNNATYELVGDYILISYGTVSEKSNFYKIDDDHFMIKCPIELSCTNEFPEAKAYDYITFERR